jgi:hypothetical protein
LYNSSVLHQKRPLIEKKKFEPVVIPEEIAVAAESAFWYARPVNGYVGSGCWNELTSNPATLTLALSAALGTRALASKRRQDPPVRSR